MPQNKPIDYEAKVFHKFLQDRKLAVVDTVPKHVWLEFQDHNRYVSCVCYDSSCYKA
ncbi:uncharacterized protein METZ01_LOCUS412179 [marine metagenome]|uniref:Uncharacterized protein n=1 Tax=marine metagenome TaxID=408172 RepID=A0A382WLY8_9ZZZZ